MPEAEGYRTNLTSTMFTLKFIRASIIATRLRQSHCANSNKQPAMTRHAALLVISLLCSTAPSASAATSSCNDVFPDRAAAAAFVSQWAGDWNRIDIAAVVAHLSDDARMRSPLATRLAGDL